MSQSIPALIPQPSQCQRLEGASFTLTAATVITATSEFHPTAKLLAARIEAATSWKLKIATTADGSTGSCIELRSGSTGSDNPEAYTLNVTEQGAVITASASAGAFYGCQTLLQLFPAAIFSQALRPDFVLTAPSVEISDHPRFPWRGVMVDSSRFFSANFLS